MARCPNCLREISSDASSCASCGHSFDDATRRLDNTARQTTSSTSFDSIDDARFVPGTILADRYRIVGLLGRGGMGEVYRADDLKLAQPVALKFLPDDLLRDGAALARFHREVRVARQVSHKNVCRVYDIAEFDGRHFLSMEFIKGEELSSLLRRIGRLPQDKAVQIARQICAGLAAAHDNGVLHRDLKPSNVMIDEHGNARITDFGLAGLEEELREDDAVAGTPAYMAPEQFDGQPATVRTDIYSLGLVLYELFTGKTAFKAGSINDLIRLRRSDSTPTAPSAIVKGLDPLIEKIIDRCLEKDPELRPSSALQVAASLPGGDPIAVALAAGETPSPEMVAAAPKQGVLKPPVALALLLTVTALIAICAWLTKYTAIYRMMPLNKSPEVLRARAQDLIKEFGYSDPAIDMADGVLIKDDILSYVKANDPSPSRWSKAGVLAGGPYRFWYRQSPRYFGTIEEISNNRPAHDVSGMTMLFLDMQGQLHWFIGVPPQIEPQVGTSSNSNQSAADWSIPFREAGLDITTFQTVASTSVPLHAYDARAAWDGVDPSHPELSVHIEAASFHGKLIYFETIYAWDRPGRQVQQPESGRDRALSFIVIGVFILAIIGSAWLARKNLRLGRGDRRGATRLAFCYFIFRFVTGVLIEHHNGLLWREFDLFVRDLADAIMGAVLLWLLYIALEPFVRRRWPGRIISWNRLLAGGYRDPMVGRDILIGAAFGCGMMFFNMLAFVGLRWLGRPPELAINQATLWLGADPFLRMLATPVMGSLFLSFFSLFLLLLFVVVLRSVAFGSIALWILLTTTMALITGVNPIMLPFTAIASGLAVFVLVRFGLLAMIATMFYFHVWVFFPFTTDLTAWYATQFLLAMAICFALVAYSFYTSLGGAKLIRGGLLEE